MKKIVLAVLLTTGAAIAACGSDSTGTKGTGGSAGESTTTPTTSSSGSGGGTTTSSEGGGGAGGEAGGGGNGGNGGAAVTCDGINGTDVKPGDSEPCDQTEDGTPVVYGPGGMLQGICKRGTHECGTTGKFGKCIGAVGASTRDCTSQDDNDCNGTADAGECPGCDAGGGMLAALGETAACFTFPAPALPDTGVCVGGTKTCNATPDKTALAWSDCAGEVGPTSATDSCDPAANGNENCDGTDRGGCACLNGATEGCGSCGGNHTCVSGQYGACSVATPPNFGQSCGACGGNVLCNGSCSVPTPSNLNQACGSCGGHVLCNNSCSVSTPSNYGTTVNYSTNNDSFSCCFINQTRFYGGTCTPGYRMAGCTVTKTGGGGTVYVQSSGDNETTDCSCAVHINNNGTEGATYTVYVDQIRRCN